MKVLVLDDSRSQRTLMRMALAGAGYEIIEASSGDEALQHLKAEPFNLVISDINMPGMNGFEFLQQVRSLHSHNATPVVVLSSDSQNQHEEALQKTRVQAWMRKPFQVEELVGAVQKLTT